MLGHSELPRPDAWVTAGDALYAVWGAHADRLARGEVALGYVFMANTALFEPGQGDAPGGVVYSWDPLIERDPERLVAIGDRLFQLHRSGQEQPPPPTPRSPADRVLFDQLETGLERVFHSLLPAEATGGPLVYHSTLMLFRRHLPEGFLRSSFLPVLVLREPGGTCSTVPAALWA